MRTSEPEADGRPKYRLLIVSSRARHTNPVTKSVLPTTKIIAYNYENATLDSIYDQIVQTLQGHKAECVGVIFHGDEHELNICGRGKKVLNTETAASDASIRDFFKMITYLHLDKSMMNARLDFLAAYPANSQAGPIITSSLTSLLEIPVSMSADLFGRDVQITRWLSEGSKKETAGELYFDVRELRDGLRNLGGKRKTKDLNVGYEKIRTVGKGAFGTAVLYRRKEDDMFVIIKEINMFELGAAERQLSLNEVNALAMMNHPNIISYLDSFERDNFLCIEMEYADGGNLAQFLQERTKRLHEKDILVLFHQICSAIKYMHDQNILHRDLKSANIFLTKQGTVKVGDLGISKMLDTEKAKANTLVGTPYYISPEVCEGKDYDEKRDIWALGCILYEMACLQKTFEGSNLPALVNKIMKGQFAPIKGNYSPGFKQLVRDLLQRDPEFRPTCHEIVTERLPELLAQFDYDSSEELDIDDKLKQSLDLARRGPNSRPMKPHRSVVYHLKVYDSSISLTPVTLPPRIRVKEMAVSNTHIIVLSSECLVYAWGEGRKGQLATGSLEEWRSKPSVIENLKEKGITKVCAGDGFSVFASDNGMVMTCGDGTFGCLGHGDWNSSTKPELIEALLSVDVSAIACGSHHVVVVGGDGEVYSWGRGEGGRLGQGHQDDCCIPTEVEIHEDFTITNVKCGGDGTILLTDQGAMLACGKNTRNKLGLSESGGLFTVKKEVEKVLVPTRIRSVGCRVVDVAMGPSHTVVLTETGQILAFGRNSEAQLGKGNFKSTSQPVLVRSMSNKIATMIQCGSTFTVAGTLDNAIYLWGTRAVSPSTRPNTQEGFSNTWGQRSALGSAIANGEKDPEFNFQEINLDTVENGTKTDSASSSAKRVNKDINMRDVLKIPQEILALYASPAQVAKGETVTLSALHCQNQSIFLVVDTTVPIPKLGKKPNLSQDNKHLTEAPKAKRQTEEIVDREEHKEEDTDSLSNSGPVPDWLRRELNEALVSRPKNREPAPQATEPHKAKVSTKEKKFFRGDGGRHLDVPQPKALGRPPFSKSIPEKPMKIEMPPQKMSTEPDPQYPPHSVPEDRPVNDFGVLLPNNQRSNNDAVLLKEEALNQEIQRLRQELQRQQELQTSKLSAIPKENNNNCLIS